MTDDRVSSPGTVRGLARDAVLVSIDASSGKLYKGAPYVAAAALLAELVRLRKVEVEEDHHRKRLVVTDGAPVGEKHLDASLDVVRSGIGGRRLRKLIGIVPQTAEVLKGLVSDGEVVEETTRRFGLKVRRYRPAPGSRHDDLVRAVSAVLLGEAVPDERTALLVSVLVGVAPDRFVERRDLKQARRRVEEVLERLSDDERAVVVEARRATANDNDPSSGST